MKRFLNNLSTNGKLLLSFGILLVLMLTLIVTAMVNNNALIESQKTLRFVHAEQALILVSIRSDVNHSRADILEMMLTPDATLLQSLKQGLSDRDTKIDDSIASLLLITHEADTLKNIQLLKNELAAYRQIREKEIALILSGRVEEARQLGTSSGAEKYLNIRRLTYDMGSAEIANMDSQLITNEGAANFANRVQIIVGVIALLLAVSLVVLLNQTISRPLTSITKIAEQIGGGDLTVTLPEEQRRDEIGALNGAFRQMLATLKKSTSDLSEAVGLLGSSASEILAATTQVASGTAEAAASISETTTTVEEVRQAAQLSSQKAQSVSDSAQRVAQVTQSGQKAVAETSAGMDHIREQMETIAQTVVRLSEQSQSIGGIIASVTDLADQSNLLAVNAAIEAAKAGEQGRGFAVVAQEIRSLAEQSKQATKQVRGILSDVQKATSNAVMATEQGSKAVEAGVKQAEQAGEAIRTLAESSGEAVQVAIQIVASSQQQVVGMDQIGVAMENINQAGAQTASSMRQMEVAAQNLHELGETLKTLVEQFKVNQEIIK